jgi:DDE superfamily endonuclease
VAADRPFYSGKHRRHGMNLQVIATPVGDIVWVSGPLPGAVHDLTAARIGASSGSWPPAALLCWRTRAITALATRCALLTGAGGKPASQKDANRARVQLRSPAERANTQLKTWRILRKLRCCPWRAGQLAKAIHVLQARETGG